MSAGSDLCRVCGTVALVSLTELMQKFCTKCGPRILQELETARLSADDLRKKNEDLIEQTRKFEEIFQKQTANFTAEGQGKEAARRGLGDEENPYPPERPEHIFWLYGWFHESSQAKLLEVRGSIVWSLEVLGHVLELAQGYGQDEIVRKLESIVTKVGPYVSDLIGDG